MCRNSLERQGNVYMYVRIVPSSRKASVFRDVPTSAQSWNLPTCVGATYTSWQTHSVNVFAQATKTLQTFRFMCSSGNVRSGGLKALYIHELRALIILGPHICSGCLATFQARDVIHYLVISPNAYIWEDLFHRAADR